MPSSVDFPSFRPQLDRPAGLEDASWAAISVAMDRLTRAITADDLSQAIGVAKELVESVAKSVLTVRGEVVAGNADFTFVVSKAHEVLKRQPGKDLTQSEPLRSVIQNAKTIACKLGELRNSYGTGHGRAQEPPVTAEIAQLCIDSAWMWSRWALRRLDAVAQGMPTTLISDLIDGAIFRAGSLTDRLLMADMPNLESQMQRRIGVAVGQRAMRQTFVVQDDGVEKCAMHDDPEVWPPAYREGVFEGMFINPFGQLTIDPWSVDWAARVIAPLPNPSDVITKLTASIDEVTMAEIPSDPQPREEILRQLDASLVFLPPEARPAWRDLVNRLRAAFARGV